MNMINETMSRTLKYMTIYLVVCGILGNALVVPKIIRGAEIGIKKSEVYIELEGGE